MATKTVSQKLDELFEKWYAHIQRTDVTALEMQAYREALGLIEDARRVSPNKALRTVQDAILHRFGRARDKRDFTPVGTAEHWEHQAAVDAYRQLREDMNAL